MKSYIGWFLIIYALVFSMTMTNYFGRNWLPNTKEELMCDISSLLIVTFGIFLKTFNTKER